MKLLNVLLLTTSLSAFYTYAETDYQWLRDDSRSEPAVKQFWLSIIENRSLVCTCQATGARVGQ